MTEPVQGYTPNTEPNETSDFFQGDVRSGIEQMRARLLEFKSNNPLLNFPETSSRPALRIIDELPEILFKKLKQGDSLSFRPVPEPTRDDSNPVLLEEFDICIQGEEEDEAIINITPVSTDRLSSRLHAVG